MVILRLESPTLTYIKSPSPTNVYLMCVMWQHLPITWVAGIWLLLPVYSSIVLLSHSILPSYTIVVLPSLSYLVICQLDVTVWTIRDPYFIFLMFTVSRRHLFPLFSWDNEQGKGKCAVFSSSTCHDVTSKFFYSSQVFSFISCILLQLINSCFGMGRKFLLLWFHEVEVQSVSWVIFLMDVWAHMSFIESCEL